MLLGTLHKSSTGEPMAQIHLPDDTGKKLASLLSDSLLTGSSLEEEPASSEIIKCFATANLIWLLPFSGESRGELETCSDEPEKKE